MEKEQTMMADAQKAKFCSIMLEKFRIKTDYDELLPIYYIAYQSALMNDTNNKKTHDSIQ